MDVEQAHQEARDDRERLETLARTYLHRTVEDFAEGESTQQRAQLHPSCLYKICQATPIITSVSECE